ncbi:hypothetical protein J6S35_00695 [Candidatus Saccharibacteria bacterium]|nr:hypothetical protein [Candidatus Saccharibacteria bacterium]
MRKMTMMLLSTALVIGFAGCGTTSSSTTVAISEDSISLDNDASVEAEISIEEPIDPTSEAIVEDFEYEEPEIEADALWDHAEETPEETSSGALFSQPIPTASEMYSESDLDNYLANAKVNYQDYLSQDDVFMKFDAEGFMSACGYENVGGFNRQPYMARAGWWIERNGIKICYTILDNGTYAIHAENSTDSVCAVDLSYDDEDGIILSMDFFTSEMIAHRKVSMRQLKNLVAVAYCLSSSDEIDFARMPVIFGYRLNKLESLVNIDKELNFIYDNLRTDTKHVGQIGINAEEYVVYE